MADIKVLRNNFVSIMKNMNYSKLFANMLFDKCEEYNSYPFEDEKCINYYWHAFRHAKLLEYIKAIDAENISKDMSTYFILNELNYILKFNESKATENDIELCKKLISFECE